MTEYRETQLESTPLRTMFKLGWQTGVQFRKDGNGGRCEPLMRAVTWTRTGIAYKIAPWLEPTTEVFDAD